MFDGMLILRIPSTSLVEKTHLEKMHAILNPMTNSYKKKKPHSMAAFQAHPQSCFFFFLSLLWQMVVDIFFIFFLLTILTTRPI